MNLSAEKNRRKGSEGFTLVEVLISLVICVVTLTAILFSNGRVGTANEVAFQRMTAVQDAHQVVERMRETAVLALFPNNVMTAFPEGAAVAGFQNLLNETVTVNYGGAADPLDVTVTVSWQDPAGRQMQYRMYTLMTQRE